MYKNSSFCCSVFLNYMYMYMKEIWIAPFWIRDLTRLSECVHSIMSISIFIAVNLVFCGTMILG